MEAASCRFYILNPDEFLQSCDFPLGLIDSFALRTTPFLLTQSKDVLPCPDGGFIIFLNFMNQSHREIGIRIMRGRL